MFVRGFLCLPSVGSVLRNDKRLLPSLLLQSDRRSLTKGNICHHGGSHHPVGRIHPGEEHMVVRSPWEDVIIPEMNVTDYVFRNIENYKTNVAVVCGVTGTSYSYQVIQDMAAKFGSAMVRQGAVKGDVLGLVLPNIPEFVMAFLGGVGAGLIVTTCNPSYSAEEMARQFGTSHTKYIMTVELFFPKVKQAVDTIDAYGCRQIDIIICGMGNPPLGTISFLKMVMADDGSLYKQNVKEMDPHKDVAVLPFSSGTTGLPKGVCLTHFNLVASLQQCHKIWMANLDTWMMDGKQEITLAILPFFHIYSLSLGMLLNLSTGNKIITLPKFEPECFLDSLSHYKPSILQLVPPLVSFLASSPLVTDSHLSSVKLVTGGAAPFGPALVGRFINRILPGKVLFCEKFGMTETSGCTHVQTTGVSGGCGHPVPNTMAKVVDMETGEALGEGEQGELCVSGPQVMLGYRNNETATQETVMDGWLHTGDVAMYDSTGHFTIVDRIKELIKVSGFQVSPSELEDVIRRHPGVRDVAVIGLPDEKMGESPQAFVIRQDKSVKKEDIIKYVTERVAPHKKLEQGVVFVESLPKSQSGKLLRRELKKMVLVGSFGPH